ncbi:MAG: sensor histidine kinase [Frankiales bacterium]|nr:sensor histidine kinase [Frankiales bacterium]
MALVLGIETAELDGFEHDIVNQLNTIRLLAELLRDELGPNTTSGKRARQLTLETRWLEMLWRAERVDLASKGGGEPPGWVRLDTTARELARTLGSVATIRIHVHTEPVAVQMPPTSLGRALRNLLWNALTASGPDGEIAVSVLATSGSAVIRIKDGGTGIDAEGERAVGGGLRVVREAVLAAGGTLYMENGQTGCTVTVILPRAVERRRTHRCAS